MGAPEPGAERPGGSLHPRMWAVDRPGLGGRRQAVACAPGQMARRRPGLSPEGRPCCLMVGGNPHRNGVRAAHGARVLLTNLSPQPPVCPACLPSPRRHSAHARPLRAGLSGPHACTGTHWAAEPGSHDPAETGEAEGAAGRASRGVASACGPRQDRAWPAAARGVAPPPVKATG